MREIGNGSLVKKSKHKQHQLSCQGMDQQLSTSSANEDHEMWLEATEKDSEWTLYQHYFVNVSKDVFSVL